MLKSTGLLLGGGVVGAVAMSLVLGFGVDSRDSAARSSLLDSVTSFTRGRDVSTNEGGVSVAARLAAYEAVQSEVDPANLERALSEAAARAWSVERDLRIDATLARIAEISPAGAARLALANGLEPGFVADAWLGWAGSDPDAALAALDEIDSPRMRREIALVLLDLFGAEMTGAQRIIAALPAADHDAFTVEWLARLAETDFYAAFREARVVVNPGLQRRALTAVAAAWAAQDPLSALAQADILPESLRQNFRSAVVSEWARLDAGGYLAYLESTPSPPLEFITGARLLSVAYPERFIRIAEGLPGDIGRSLMMTALSAMAQADPEAAMARLDSVPPGRERNTLVQSIGLALAQKDPDAALEWAKNLSPPSPDALRSVVMQIAQSDFERAFDLIDNPFPGVDAQLIYSVVSSTASRFPEQSTRIASRLADRDDRQSAAALAQFVSNWMSRDPEAALDWVLEAGAEVDTAVYSRAAQVMANQDPAAAAAYVERIPEAHRSAWIIQVATQYGVHDANGAVAWLARYQGSDLYDRAVGQVIVGAAQTDPRAAASLMAQAGQEAELGIADRVASSWAQREPRAATRWAAELADDRARSAAIRSATSVWFMQNPPAAKAWVLDLRSGETRDGALTGMIQSGAANGNFDSSLLNAISSDAARQNALQGSIPVLARTDPGEARALLDQVTNLDTRREIENMIERLGVSFQ